MINYNLVGRIIIFGLRKQTHPLWLDPKDIYKINLPWYQCFALSHSRDIFINGKMNLANEKVNNNKNL
jgi:hypothetical protein